MAGRKILITGGGGFLGVAVAKRLLTRKPDEEIILTDIVAHPRLRSLKGKVCFVQADLGDPSVCASLVTPEVGTVFHFASLVSGGAEKDFAAGLRANVHATMHLLEACRLAGGRPRFVFTSSIATFGGVRLPESVDDWTFQHPENSYGAAKVLGEQLLNDYTRKGYLDGRGIRLPAIVVRDEPNTAVTGYLSALVRETVAGRDYICPVPPETRIPILSAKQCTSVLVALADLPEGAYHDFRTINGPSLSPTAGEIAAAIRATSLPVLGRIEFAAEPAAAVMLASWPREMRSERALALGLRADSSIAAIVSDYIQETGFSASLR